MIIRVSYKSTHIPSLNHPHPHSHSNSQSRPFHRRTLLYKTPFSPTISLVLRNQSTPSTPTTPRRTKTRASIPREVEGKGELLIPTHCSSSSWFNCFVPWKKMVLIDQHVLWTFFASLLGFVLLYTLRRNSSKRTTNKKNFPEECAEESFADGVCRPVNGSGTDVIIVGAGVAGSALAYTLGKVKFSC
jgi:hypothetical protein